MDIVTYILCRKASAGYVDEAVSALGKGMQFKGTVASKAELPASPEPGDLYITDDEGKAYVWSQNEGKEGK